MKENPRVPRLAAATLGLACLAAIPSDLHAARLTVVVVVVDSLMPDELGQTWPATPVLTAFRDGATSYAESRSVFSAETIPNHVSMMTGVYPDRSGIPTNTFWNRSGTPEERDLSLPTELEARTIFTRIREACPQMKTAAALSKNYLYEVFSECGYSGVDCGVNTAPDASFDPASDPTYIEPSGHTPDSTTMREARAYLPEADFLFVNLGDVDRVGHIDASGAVGPPAERHAALADTDALVGQLISDLEAAGRWQHTVMIVLSDHGMDWSLATNYVNLAPELEPGLFALQAGGTGSIYVVDPLDPLRSEKLADARALALSHSGVANAWYREPNPVDPGEETLLPDHLAARHENFGDLIVMAHEGWRISEPDGTSNPLPGNHGHATTLHNTFLVGGGLEIVRSQTVGDPGGNADHFLRLDEQSENTDVAATIAWLFGLDAADMDGRVLGEAFAWRPSPSDCGEILDRDGDGTADYEDPCPLLADETDCICPPQPATGCVTDAAAKVAMRRDEKNASVKFSWTRGAAIDTGDFGDPLTGDSVAACAYAGDAAQLSAMRLPSGAHWSRSSNGQFRYKDPDRAPDGVASAVLRPGTDGKTKIAVKAAGANASVPGISSDNLPLQLQVHSASGHCWAAAFETGDVSRNDGERFTAESSR